MVTMRMAGTAVAAALLAGSAPAQVVSPTRPATMRTMPPLPMPAPRMPIPAAALLPDTQAVLEAAVKAGRIPGAVAAIGRGDGPTLFLSAGRIADAPDAQAAGPDSLWRVYSMTKPVTAAAAMILVEEGKLRLDEPVATYLPAFAHLRVLDDPTKSLASHPATRPITIRELLTHTAGLGYSIIPTGVLPHEYERAGLVPATLDARTEAQLRTVRPRTLLAFADKVATEPLLSEPGTKWSYSIGLDVMGAVIEKVSGVPFDRFVQTRIFQPLGMTASFWTVPAADAPRLATNYAAVMGRRVPVDAGATSVWLSPPEFPYGGAGLVMSARDYDIFLHALQAGGAWRGARILKPETVALMTGNLLPPGVVFAGSVNGTGAGAGGGGAATQPAGFGAGGSVYTADGPGGFPGAGTYGWGGAAGTIAFFDPKRGVRVTVMLNLMGGVPGLREQLVAAMVRDGKRLHGQ
jgi:CubicO group peptidase (beta-lactamase class C family)